MGILIDALLDLARLSRNQIERRPMDLSQLANGVIAELRRAEPGRRVQVAIDPGLRVNADAGLMRVLLDNLIGNAWKFTRKRCDPRIEFRAIQNGGGVTTYLIRDNGAGFDMAYANKLFGAFQRLHDMNDFEGTGIGLATVQRIVRRHGGRVWAEGGVNEGATFYFTL
jgi:light-regulated signal transduction histidine kinase (bacteriophytochrome)